MQSKASNVLVEKLQPLPYPSALRWDVAMTADEIRRLSWQEKKSRSLTSLMRKVLIVQNASLSLNNLLSESYIPADRVELREWTDPQRGLWPWIDVKLDNPNLKNSGIMDVFFNALREINNLKNDKISPYRAEISRKNATIINLEAQVVRLTEEVNDLRAKVYRK